MEIVYVPVSQIIPYEGNAKIHPDEQVGYIANSIKEFGFKQPLVIDTNNFVVVGHGRLLAAKQLGMTEVPCIIADDLTPNQIKAYRPSDNKTNESEWDLDILVIELGDIYEYNMVDFGFYLGESDENITDNMDSDNGKKYNNTEIDKNNFNDDRFEHECPKCGFKYN